MIKFFSDLISSISILISSTILYILFLSIISFPILLTYYTLNNFLPILVIFISLIFLVIVWLIINSKSDLGSEDKNLWKMLSIFYYFIWLIFLEITKGETIFENPLINIMIYIPFFSDINSFFVEKNIIGISLIRLIFDNYIFSVFLFHLLIIIIVYQIFKFEFFDNHSNPNRNPL